MAEPRGKLDTITKNGPEDALNWDAVDWRVDEHNVVRLRRRIFKATFGVAELDVQFRGQHLRAYRPPLSGPADHLCVMARDALRR
jgi:hypothetical protein